MKKKVAEINVSFVSDGGSQAFSARVIPAASVP